MEINKLSKEYNVRRLDYADVETIFELCSNNIIYYQYCPPFVTKEGIVEDMKALPPGKNQNDKYYLGYYDNNILIGVLDLITGYPNESTAYIGFFMTDINIQGNGMGTKMIEELCDYLKISKFQRVELAWVKGNPQSENFWIKNGFIPIEERSSKAAEHVIVAQRQLV